MPQIYVYNRNIETHLNDANNYPIYRPNILGNPYTHIKDKKTKARFICSSRDESIRKYDEYFDIMYGANAEFTDIINEIYNKYKNGEDIYLECYCKKYATDDIKVHNDEILCHGDIIARKIKQKLLKEKLKNNIEYAKKRH